MIKQIALIALLLFSLISCDSDREGLRFVFAHDEITIGFDDIESMHLLGEQQNELVIELSFKNEASILLSKAFKDNLGETLTIFYRKTTLVAAARILEPITAKDIQMPISSEKVATELINRWKSRKVNMNTPPP